MILHLLETLNPLYLGFKSSKEKREEGIKRGKVEESSSR